MRLAPAGLAALVAVSAFGLCGCAGAPSGDDDAEGARRAAETYLHRIGAGDARGVCDLGLARDGRTPLARVPEQHAECVRIYSGLLQGDRAQAYASLTTATVAQVVVDGNHASVAKADTTGADLIVRNDRTMALLRVDGTWYVGSDDAPTREAGG